MTARVLVIGTGSIGERHVRCFLATGRATVAICEIDDRLRAEVAGRHAVSGSFASLDEALRESFDAAVVATPAHLHVPIATRLAGRGIGLLIEKPLATGLDGVDALREAVAERGVAAAVAYVYRVHPALVAMRDAIASGRFGAPHELVAVAGQCFPKYRPAYREIYFADRARGGGAIQDALTHVINAGEWLLGPVTRVCFDAAHRALEGVDVEDTVHGIARHGIGRDGTGRDGTGRDGTGRDGIERDGVGRDGVGLEGDVPASYSLNLHQAPFELSMTIVCERGTARFEYHRERWRWMSEPGGDWHDEPVGPLERDTLFAAQAGVFLDVLEGRAQPPCSLEDGIRTLRVNLAVLRSVERGAWESLES